MNKLKYITTDPHNMNNYYKEGYEYLFHYSNTQTDGSTHHSYVTGHFMGNDVSLNMPINKTYNTINVVMQLTKQAELLYGEKRENNATNSNNNQ